MKKDFVVSKIETPRDGSQYVLIVFTDQNELASADKSGEAIPFTSPEDIMKNLPKVMSKMFGTGGGMHGNSPALKITMKEYEEMALNVGDRVGIEINKVK